MFLGTHTPRLDDKGRLALPARFRSDLDGGLVITKGQERCLFVFPIVEFNRLTEAMQTTPAADKRVRNYSRIFFASASHEVPDGQGRITVPQPLRQYAGLEKDCVVIGANSRIEVWNADRVAGPTSTVQRAGVRRHSRVGGVAGRPVASRRGSVRPPPVCPPGVTSPMPGGQDGRGPDRLSSNFLGAAPPSSTQQHRTGT